MHKFFSQTKVHWIGIKSSVINHVPSLFIWVLTSISTQCIGYITMGSFMGRGDQYIQLVKVLYCKQSTNGKQLPAFPREAGPGFKLRSQRWEERVLRLCHCGPFCKTFYSFNNISVTVDQSNTIFTYFQGHYLHWIYNVFEEAANSYHFGDNSILSQDNVKRSIIDIYTGILYVLLW